jgi:phosphoribosylformylglycinamidine synthase
MVLRPGKEARAKEIFDKWDLDIAVVGRTTDTGRLVVRHQGRTEADIPIGALAHDAPVYNRPWKPTEPQPQIAPEDVPAPNSLSETLIKMMGSPDLCSRRWIWEQYDHMVMADTVARPGGDAAVVRVHGTTKGLAMTTDVTPRYCAADPVMGGRQAVAEAWRNLTCVGADPLAITDCMNFGNPQRPEIMGQFAGAVEGMADACRALAFPVVSGNVSLYNETNGRGIQPTPAIGGVGLVPDITVMATVALKAEGDALLLIGEERGHLGQSLYQRDIVGHAEGAPPPVDLAREKAAGDLVRSLVRARDVTAVHDCADGGLWVAVAEMALAGDIGADITLGDSGLPAHAVLFGEDQGRYVVACAADRAAEIADRACRAGVAVRALGTAGGRQLTVDGAQAISLDDLRTTHEGWLPRFMGATGG